MLFGLYYNTPLTQSQCQNSRLFESFSKFILNRLQIEIQPKTKKLRVTIITRQTKHRRILNLAKLHKALLDHSEDYEVIIAPFSHNFPFKKQLEIVANTDILVGIHGAGLTHMLFLPKWAVIFELYDCQDPSCYKDLARLCGLKHISWSKMDKLYPEEKPLKPQESYDVSAKFTNYAFDPEEFLEKIKEAAEHVKKFFSNHDEL